MQAVDAINYTIKMPVGVAGLISPWNLPMYLLTFKLAPAIIAGNTVVSKPSEMTSVTAWKLGELMNEAGRHIMTSRLTCFWGGLLSHRDIYRYIFISVSHRRRKSLKDNRFDFTDDMYISMTPLLFAFV